VRGPEPADWRAERAANEFVAESSRAVANPSDAARATSEARHNRAFGLAFAFALALPDPAAQAKTTIS
jgi:hypothetical protein